MFLIKCLRRHKKIRQSLAYSKSGATHGAWYTILWVGSTTLHQAKWAGPWWAPLIAFPSDSLSHTELWNECGQYCTAQIIWSWKYLMRNAWVKGTVHLKNDNSTLLTLISLQTCMTFLDTREDILKNVGNQKALVHLDKNTRTCLKLSYVPQKKVSHTGLERHEVG